jgi:hypothetical protein
MANFKKNTRYTNGQIDTNRSGKQFLVLRKALKLEPNSGDVFVAITQDILQRPDLIAHKAYGIPELWWAIYEFNGIHDPLFELKLGQTIRIPAIKRVLEAIDSMNKK